MSHSSREPDGAAIPSGSGVRHPPGGYSAASVVRARRSRTETVSPRRRAAPINSDLMNWRAGIGRSSGRFRARKATDRGPRRLHAELKAREAMFPLDDGEARRTSQEEASLASPHQWRIPMRNVKLLSAVLLTAATFATPVLAASAACRHRCQRPRDVDDASRPRR